MMKLLHSADWHLDSPFQGRDGDQSAFLKAELLKVPGKIAALCREEGCRILLLSGDLFDGPYTRESLDALRNALEDAAVPAFIAPGNHDFCGTAAPWTNEHFPGNVHIFTRPAMESVVLPDLDCRIYGAGYRSMDCPPLLEGFRADCGERYAIGILHGDAAQSSSPYCPVTREQVLTSGLDYLALGHIHKTGSFRVGPALCAWPGSPMGRGFDELGDRGVLVVTLEERAEAEFRPLDTVRFHDLETELSGLPGLLPPVECPDFYRVTLSGEAGEFDLAALYAEYAHLPHLQLRDRTVLPVDLWAAINDDTLEGTYFRLLREALSDADEAGKEKIRLAARISRQILDGQEVKLP